MQGSILYLACFGQEQRLVWEALPGTDGGWGHSDPITLCQCMSVAIWTLNSLLLNRL